MDKTQPTLKQQPIELQPFSPEVLQFRMNPYNLHC